jgi:hypothetical protein
MALRNKTGGAVHTDREQQTLLGASRTLYANQPNEVDWIFNEMELSTGELARQCTASVRVCKDCDRICGNAATKCPECGGEVIESRCREIAAFGKNTCATHGGTFALSPQHKAKLMRSTVVSGTTFNQIMYCPCQIHGANCKYINQYYDADGCARCAPEKQLYDSIIDHFSRNYDFNSDADLIILQRLAMTIVRITRNERYIAMRGEIIKRERGAPDGSVETWFEPNAASVIISKLDSQLLQWLKGLNITRAARENKEIIQKMDFLTLLCDRNVKEIEI